MGNEITISDQWEIQRRTVAALCAMRKWGDHFDYAVSEDCYIRLRVRGKVDDMHLAIQFPRSTEMSPYYKEIRDWFESHRVEWKDRTHQGERYMTAQVPLDADWVHGLVVEAGQVIFGSDVLMTINRTPVLYIEHVIARRPRLWFACLLLLPVVTTCFWLYEVGNALRLTSPSLANVTAIEWMFVLLLGGCLVTLRRLLHRPILNARVRSFLQLWGVRAFLLIPIILAFMTG